MPTDAVYKTGNAVKGRGWNPQTDIVVNFPGSPKSLKESLEYILPELIHGVEILQGIAKECELQRKRKR